MSTKNTSPDSPQSPILSVCRRSNMRHYRSVLDTRFSLKVLYSVLRHEQRQRTNHFIKTLDSLSKSYTLTKPTLRITPANITLRHSDSPSKSYTNQSIKHTRTTVVLF
jgi:hypothetical protein